MSEMVAESTKALGKALAEHAWQDDTAQVGFIAAICSCNEWRGTVPERDIYALRAAHDAHRAAALIASGAVRPAAALPLSLADTQRVVGHLIHDGTRDGLILGDLLNVAMGASARRRAALAEEDDWHEAVARDMDARWDQ